MANNEENTRGSRGSEEERTSQLWRPQGDLRALLSPTPRKEAGPSRLQVPNAAQVAAPVTGPIIPEEVQRWISNPASIQLLQGLVQLANLPGVQPQAAQDPLPALHATQAVTPTPAPIPTLPQAEPGEVPGMQGLVPRLPVLPEENLLPANTNRSVMDRLGAQHSTTNPQRASIRDRLRVSAHDRLGPNQARNRTRFSRNSRTDYTREESTAESSAVRATESDERIVQLEKQLRELQDQLRGSKDAHEQRMIVSPPFTQRIMGMPFPKDFKHPNLRQFDGRTDPKDHLTMYQAHMGMMGMEEHVLCRAFLSTLSGKAAEWFNTLPPGSIDSFVELARKFAKRFVGCSRKRKHFTHLSSVKQKEGETMTKFLDRWNQELLEVEHVDDQGALTMFLSALRSGELYTEFHRNPPTSYNEAFDTARQYAMAEEANREKRNEEGFSTKKDRPKDVSPERRTENKKQRIQRSMRRFTPLTAPAAEVLQYAEQCNLIGTPEQQAREPQNADTSKYCHFHRVHGHDTENCITLRKAIEKLIRNGELQKFVKRDKQWSNTWKRDGHPSKVEGTSSGRDKEGSVPDPTRNKPNIAMIFGGPEGGDSMKKRKRWVRQLYIGSVQAEPREAPSQEPITFTNADLSANNSQHNDALVVTMDIMGTDVMRTLVDTGSSVNVLYYDTFVKLGLRDDQLTPLRTPLSGFTGDSVDAEGSIELPVMLGTAPHVKKLTMRFVVVKLRCVHNAILGRPGITAAKAIISMEHLCLKFHTDNGIGVMRGNQMTARNCYLEAVKKFSSGPGVNTVSSKVERDNSRPRPEPGSELEEILLWPDQPERVVKIGKGLPEDLRARIVQVLSEYRIIFAYGPEDMPGIDRSVICHRLSVLPDAKPVRQKKRHLSEERREFVKTEVGTLLRVGHIREVKYPEWLSNVVLAPKPPTYRMCVDFTDLNKACPMDPFPLPNPDQLVDETARCELLSFMDAFRGYHQIFMAPEDEEKTAFVTPEGIYCYIVMAFGLRNSGATYQRMVNKLFKELLGTTMEAYVDDMLVKSKSSDDHPEHLAQCFEIMRKFNLRLNPKKCAFAVRTGKFLGYMVTGRGIEPNPDKVKAIVEMEPPRSVRDVQRLTGRLAALSRFLSKMAERSLPFFQIVKKASNFEWTEDCQLAFDQLKEYLMSSPVLSKPEPGEVLYLYLGISEKAISSVLVREDDRIQYPIYYVSRALHGAELRYSVLEKAALAMVVTAKRLAAYFQAHEVVVLTDQQLGNIFRSPTASGRLVKWAMMLTQFNINYRPRPSIKAQALADFIVECTAREPASATQPPTVVPWWEVSTDGSSNAKGCGGGVVVTTPEGFKLYSALIFKFKATNNQAEYEALLGGLRLSKQLGAERIRIRSDSRLVVGQLLGTLEAKEPRIAQYKELAADLLHGFKEYEMLQIPRAENTDADILSKLCNGVPAHISKIARIEEVEIPSIDEVLVQAIGDGYPEWMNDLKNYIQQGILPEDESRARKVKVRAPRFQMIGERLYKRSFGGPLLRCLTPSEASTVIAEVHEGVCGAHQGPRTLAKKVILVGYFWPTIMRDCEEFVRKCATCQEFHKIPGRPATYYQPITTAVPFTRWGIDLVGALPMAQGKKKYIIVAIDYFTKWVEAEALASITTEQCLRFIWKNVVSRFGVPEQIITDNGKQFDNSIFKEALTAYGIQHSRAAVAYPQANGQVENANRTILDGLKKKLSSAGMAWLDELPCILWSYRTTPRRATGETPFAMTYGAEARLPVEAMVPTFREDYFNQEDNEEALRVDLNLLEEKRSIADIKTADYRQAVKAYYDSRVKPRYFQVGDLVLRRREASKPSEGGKFAKNWEGPYRVGAVIRPGTYKLESMTGQSVPRVWNSAHLKRFYK